MFELFGIGKAWEGAFRKESLADSLGTVADSPISGSALKVNSAPQTTDNTRGRFQAASDALLSALGGLARETKPVYTTTRSEGRSSAAFTNGSSARVDPFQVHYDVLQSRTEINTNIAGTKRESTSPIGLDVTSAQSASRLSSSANLGLDVAGTSSVKVSKEEMNLGFDTAYASNTLTFANGGNTSASIGSLTGTYAASGKALDATSLTVTVTRGGEIKSSFLGLGQTRIDFEVRDQTGELIKSYSGDLEAGEVVSLGGDIGLSLSFGAGMLTTGHTSTVAVSRTPITVDANARFNAAAGSRPRFTAVTQVVAGTFEVNNTVIDVYANDTINTVLDRINNSAAGVTATVSGDKVTLTSKDASDQDIAVGSDNSGFVKAVRLDGASTTKGDIRDDQRFLNDTVVFDQVKDGSFTINGKTITLGHDADTITTVLAKINTSGAGVTASLNRTTNKIEIVSNSNSEDLINVGNDTTGFLAMAQLSTNNTVRGNIRDDQQSLSKTTQFSAVTNGSFTVNGVSISVNKDTDTLSSIINRVNDADAGVVASYDATTDKLSFTTTGTTVTLGGDTSGFLSAAHVVAGTTTTLTQADPNAAFNGTGAHAPQFDSGVSVGAGAFTVNGVSINVNANDSINSVLAKITASSAGVTATYDSATELVTLTAKDAGTGPITVGGDTSGFVAAVKLDAGAVHSFNTANRSSFTSAIGDIAEYSGVSAGTLTINGQNIAIDPATTTIRDLVGAINAVAGVGASVNETNGGIDIWSESANASLKLTDTSGVLGALGIAQGTYFGSVRRADTVAVRTGKTTTSNAIDVAAKTAAAVTQLNEAFDSLAGEELSEALETFVGHLRDQGVRGLEVTKDGDDVGLSIRQDEFVNALNALNDDADLARTLASTFEQFSADVADTAGWDALAPAAVQTLNLGETSRAQLLADQTATSLLLLKSSLQPHESEDSTQKAALKAYGEPR